MSLRCLDALAYSQHLCVQKPTLQKLRQICVQKSTHFRTKANTFSYKSQHLFYKATFFLSYVRMLVSGSQLSESSSGVRRCDSDASKKQRSKQQVALMPDMLLCTSVEWCQPTQALARDGVRQAGARDDVRQAGARDGVRQAVKRLGQHKSSLTRNSAVSGMSF